MHYFAPDRPIGSHGRRSILIDGSPLPPVIVRPLPEGKIRVEMLLRDYSKGSLYSYDYHHVVFDNPVDLSKFFYDLAEDPETTFAKYFDWTPQAITKKQLAANITAAQHDLFHASADLL